MWFYLFIHVFEYRCVTGLKLVLMHECIYVSCRAAIPQVVNLQAELTYLQTHLATLELPSPPLPAAPQMPMAMPAQFSISDLPSTTNIPTTIDLSALFEPPAQPQWALQQHHQHQLRQQPSYGAMAHRGGSSSMAEGSVGSGDLQTLARELLDRHGRSGVKPELQPPPPPHPR